MKDWFFDADAKSLPAAFFTIARKYPEAVVYRRCLSSDPSEPWPAVNFRTVEQNVNKISAALQGLGVRVGDKVAVICATRPEWMEVDLAILSAGAVSVSVYPSLNREDIAYILHDSGATVVVAENSEQTAKLLEVQSREWEIAATEERPATRAAIALAKIIAVEAVDEHPLVLQLSEILAAPEAPEPLAYRELDRSSLANLVYTSGTTGPPKGVMQTHGNHLANIRQARASTLLDDAPSILLFLPLAHAFAKLLGYIGFLTTTELRFCSVADRRSSKTNPAAITAEMPHSGAAIFPVVPRLLEKIRDGITKAAAGKDVKSRLVALTLWSARARFSALQKGQNCPLSAQAAYWLTAPLRAAICKKIFGGSFSACLSGGAKLPVELNEFFHALGMPVLEGYGLTETAVATNVSRRGLTPLGSVGPVMDSDIEMRILEDGEIAFRGPNIAAGYFNRPTATSRSFDADGWFYTGDYGSVDEHGNLYIVGRKKEIIVTSGGKNIAPNDIEEKIKQSPLVSQAVLVGDGRKYCVAVITLNAEAVARFLAEKNLPAESPHERPEVQREVWNHVASVNTTLPSYETVKKIYLAPEDFTIESGLLTPTLKIKRSAVEERYRRQIDALYVNGQ